MYIHVALLTCTVQSNGVCIICVCDVINCNTNCHLWCDKAIPIQRDCPCNDNCMLPVFAIAEGGAMGGAIV